MTTNKIAIKAAKDQITAIKQLTPITPIALLSKRTGGDQTPV
jgi:hypothetical protein